MAKKLFDFDKEFKLGIEQIDNEHLQLVELLNEVHVRLSEGQKESAHQHFTETLASYVGEHFSHEERFMESFAYPAIEEHRKIHANFRKSFLEMLPSLENADEATFRTALTDAFAWIITHIGKTDKKYAAYYLAQDKN